MKCILICDEGFETIVSNDFKNKFNIQSTDISPTAIEFEIGDKIEDYQKIAEICYTFQGAIKILTNVETFEVEDNYEKLEKAVIPAIQSLEKNLNLKSETVRFDCTRKGDHRFKSTAITDVLTKNSFKTHKRDYKKSPLAIFAYVKNEKGFIGLDFSGRILCKRDYKIFLGSNTLRGTIAYNLLNYAEYDGKETIVDPFMGSGTIPVEAGLLVSHTSPFFFTKEKFLFTKLLPDIDWESWFNEIDSKRIKQINQIYGFDSLLKFLKHSQKNAKIADINKSINLSKVEVDWIDTKFDEFSIDKIITHPPLYTEHGSTTKIRKVYSELFNRGKEILTKKGKIILINSPKGTEVTESVAKIEGYELLDKQIVYEGQEKLNITTFKLKK